MLKLTPIALLALTTLATAEPRDGSHDFDFELGKWKLKLKKLEKPLSGEQKWIELNGTSDTIPIWGGKAQLEQLDVDGPGGLHVQGFVVRTYSQAGHQWYLNWQSAKTAGAFGVPTVGAFTGDRGEFYDQEEYNGRQILVRAVWSNITKSSAHFEQAFSVDGGKTWEPNWITDQVRIP
jgi:hypothetical protein